MTSTTRYRKLVLRCSSGSEDERRLSGGGLFPARASFKRELQLQWNIGVLFPPQGNKQSWQPAPMTAQFMNNRVASRTKGDQPGGGVTAGTAMVHDALIRSSAALTAVAVAGEDGVTMSAEALARMCGLPVAAAAEPGDGGVGPAAAEPRRLGGSQQGSV